MMFGLRIVSEYRTGIQLLYLSPVELSVIVTAGSPRCQILVLQRLGLSAFSVNSLLTATAWLTGTVLERSVNPHLTS